MKTIFQFRSGCRLSGNAQAVGEHLEAIRAKSNTLTPELVLADAHADASPLHAFFEWDDSLAAQKYRVDQAGNLIRSIQVTYVDLEESAPRQISLDSVQAADEPQANPVRAFVAITLEDGQRGYEITGAAMANPDLRQQVLSRAHSELSAISRKWREVSELAEVFQALDRVGNLISTERQPA